MKYTVRNSLLACLVGVVSLVAQAQEFRIGYVNTERIAREANLAKVAETKLQQEFSLREKELANLRNALDAATEKFNQDGPTMSLDAQRLAKRKQLEDQDRDLQRKRRVFQEDLTARKYEELRLIYEKIDKRIKQIAKTEKYNMILQEAVYVDDEHDITGLVLKSLNGAE